MREITLIGNPVAGGGALRRIERAAGILRGMGYPVRLLLTGRKGDAEAFAREAAENPPGLVIAAGGDGTYNEVANGLAGSSVPMAILPMGTTSVLAREMAIPFGLDEALSVALEGRVRKAHLGRISFPEGSGYEDRYFLLMAGIGFDGEAVCRVSRGVKKIAGRAAYVLSGLRTLAAYHPEPLSIQAETEGAPVSMTAYLAVIGKASLYGGRFRITPDTDPFSPYFSVFAGRGGRRRDLLRYVVRILRGEHLGLADACSFRATAVEITGKAHVQIDGDYIGMTPARLEVTPETLSLVAPSD